jgi:hypothetical protein
MVSIETFGAVKRLRMARSLIGRAFYYTAAYWVDGLMIESGCSYTLIQYPALASPWEGSISPSRAPDAPTYCPAGPNVR